MTAAVLVAADVPAPPPDDGLPPGQPYVSPDDLASIPPLFAEAAQVALLPLVAEIWQNSAGTVHAQLVDAANLPGLPPVSSLAAETYLAQAANTFSQVGDDLWNTARSELLAGFQAGESIPQLADRLRNSAGLTARKATLVARTQVLDASNAGSYATAQTSGIDLRKGWLDTPDNRTRITHRAAGAQYGADQQMIPLADQFLVGGYSCDRPHDPSLPIGERASCRCSLIYSMGTQAAKEAQKAAEPIAPLPNTSGQVEAPPPPPVVVEAPTIPVARAADEIREVEVENAIRAAYRGLPEQRRVGVWMADLRERSGLSRDEFDTAIKRMVRADSKGIFPTAQENQQLLTLRDREAAVHIGARTYHRIKIDDPSPRPLPRVGGPESALSGRTVVQLRALAKQQGITGYTKLTKPQLLERLRPGPTATLETSGPPARVMTRAAADQWAKESKIPFDLQHGTTPEAARAIEQTGFDIARLGTKTDLGNLGAGFYFNAAGGVSYAEAEGYGANLIIRARVKKLMFTSSEDYARARTVESYVDILHSQGKSLAARFLESPVGAIPASSYVAPAGLTNAELIGDLSESRIARYLALRADGKPSGFVLREWSTDEGFGAIVWDMDLEIPGFRVVDGKTWYEVNVLNADDIVVVSQPPVLEGRVLREAARERNRIIEQRAAAEQTLAELDDLLVKKASREAFEQRIAAAQLDPKDLAALRAAVGDPAKMRAAVTRISKKQGITVQAKTGAKVKFDPALHDPVGEVPAAGTPVVVIRRGTTLTVDGDTITLNKAVVKLPTAPVKRAPVKAVKAVKAAPKKAAVPEVPVSSDPRVAALPRAAGKPPLPAKAAKATNPKFGSTDQGHPTYRDAGKAGKPYTPDMGPLPSGAYEENCTYVVNAFEMRMRGFDVAAAPLDILDKYGYAAGTTREELDQVLAAAWRLPDGSPHGRSFSGQQWRSFVEIDDEIDTTWPDGGRGFIFVGKHIFNVVKVRGKAVYYEAQFDANASRNVTALYKRKYRSAPTSQGHVGEAKLFRVDDLEPAGGVLSTVTAEPTAAVLQIAAPKQAAEQLSNSYATRKAALARLPGQPQVTALEGGISSKVELLTYQDGRRAVRKDYAASPGRRVGPQPGDRIPADSEELAAQVLDAFGIRSPAVVRVNDHTVLMEFVDGVQGGASGVLKAPVAVRDSTEGRLLGLADAVMGHRDRAGGNWLRVGDHIVPIDNGNAFSGVGADTAAYGNPFADYLMNRSGWKNNVDLPVDRGELAAIRRRLEGLRPEFARLNHLRSFDDMMGRLDEITGRAMLGGP